MQSSRAYIYIHTGVATVLEFCTYVYMYVYESMRWFYECDVTLRCFRPQLQGLKMMVRWLLGLKSNSGNSGTSTLRLLTTLILHDGDLMERGAVK